MKIKVHGIGIRRSLRATRLRCYEFVANWPTSGDYELSGGQIVRFEMRPKDKAVSLRLPDKLLDAVRGAAKRQGVPYQRFIRMAIESALDRAARK